MATEVGGDTRGGFMMIESRYHHDTAAGQQLHINYGILACKDAMRRTFTLDGEERILTPVAPHLVFTQVVTPDGKSAYVGDTVEDPFGGTRERIIELTNGARKVADMIAVYDDLGVSNGMHCGIEAGKEAGVPTLRLQLSLDMLATLGQQWGLQCRDRRREAELAAALLRVPILFREAGATEAMVAIVETDWAESCTVVPFRNWIYGKVGTTHEFKRM